MLPVDVLSIAQIKVAVKHIQRHLIYIISHHSIVSSVKIAITYKRIFSIRIFHRSTQPKLIMKAIGS